MWRGSLLPLGREAAPKPDTEVVLANRIHRITTAAQPIGDKSPRHREALQHRICADCESSDQINHRSHPN
ncbi:hypothetical protein C1893_04175 [Pseudomonas sp. MPR-ANC1]|nr:hypothetical protein C1893_04175 [Pseudomonas sp. MPR-ANC1]